MEEKGDIDKVDEVMLPGFRFHPTDEELVGFYLRRKIQQKPLCVELIKQLDIYKFDPWDLPKLASTGEKEWYFYCPRDRKYRNSARPNRVTGAGFWKATGTDRPIYSSEGTKCIGLKKSLVFYRGRAAKGIKTDWMMHEFRLPSVPDSTPNKRPMSKSFAPNDSWAICRIFKKTNSVAQRALSQTWVSSIPENNTCSDMFSQFSHRNQFNSENICTTEVGSTIEFSCNNELQNPAANFPSIVSNMEIPSNFMASSLDMSTPEKSNIDIAPMLQNLSTVILGDVCKAPTSIDFVVNNDDNGEDKAFMNKTTNLSIMNSSNWETVKSANFPFNLPFDDWKCSSTWDSPPCPN